MGDYRILPMREHYEVYNANGDFILSADTQREATEELLTILSNKQV